MTPNLKNLTRLAVNIHGRRVGLITRLAGDRQVFSLEPDYMDDPSRPTLSLSLKGSSGGLVTDLQQVNRRVPPFFSNLLPEGHLRAYLAGQAGVNPEREFFLLAALGADLPGAVIVTPLDAEGHGPTPDEPGSAGAPNAEDRRRQGALRFSLAGVQLKFSAMMETNGGLTIPAQGIGGSWIVKLPSMTFAAVSENEFVMLELARAIGIDIPRNRLVPIKEIDGLPPDAARLAGNALAVERFDRGPDGTRIHMEDFAQVFGLFPENKYKSVSYANIAKVLWAETGEQGTYEFIRRLTFSVLIGNADMHLKNWSLLYPDRRTPVLSPAYDLVSTVPYIPGDKLALTLGGSRDSSQITFDQLLRLTGKAGLPIDPILRMARETVEATAAAWRSLAQKDILPAAIRKQIGAQIRTSTSETIKALRQ